MSRNAEAACASAMGVGWAALLVWMPALVSMALALVTAVSWCIWLERHPPA